MLTAFIVAVLFYVLNIYIISYQAQCLCLHKVVIIIITSRTFTDCHVELKHNFKTYL